MPQGVGQRNRAQRRCLVDEQIVPNGLVSPDVSTADVEAVYAKEYAVVGQVFPFAQNAPAGPLADGGVADADDLFQVPGAELVVRWRQVPNAGVATPQQVLVDDRIVIHAVQVGDR